jgi:hypothetical protein
MVDLLHKSVLTFLWGLELRWPTGLNGLCSGGHMEPTPDNGNNKIGVNKLVPQKQNNSNVISMVDSIRKSVLTFSWGLELRR